MPPTPFEKCEVDYLNEFWRLSINKLEVFLGRAHPSETWGADVAKTITIDKNFKILLNQMCGDAPVAEDGFVAMMYDNRARQWDIKLRKEDMP